jgi:hypothetical protein
MTDEFPNVSLAGPGRFSPGLQLSLGYWNYDKIPPGILPGLFGNVTFSIPLAVKSSQLAQDFLRGITSRRFTLSESVFLRAVTRPVNYLFTLLLTWC